MEKLAKLDLLPWWRFVVENLSPKHHDYLGPFPTESQVVAQARFAKTNFFRGQWIRKNLD